MFDPVPSPPSSIMDDTWLTDSPMSEPTTPSSLSPSLTFGDGNKSDGVNYYGVRSPFSQPRGALPDFILIDCFDIDRARHFYARCFDWVFLGDLNRRNQQDDAAKRRFGCSPWEATEMNFFASDPTRPTRVSGALIQMQHKYSSEQVSHSIQLRRQQAMSFATSPMLHLRVPDMGVAEDRVEACGGEVKTLRFGIRSCMLDVGEFVDTEGNLMGLMAFHPELAMMTGEVNLSG